MTYQWIIIGAGPGGYEGAIRAAQLEEKVLLIEEKHVGGTCLNQGCIPTKTLLYSAQTFKAMEDFEAIGLKIREKSYDLNKIYERKNEVVQSLRKGVEGLIKQNKIDLIFGKGQITGKNQVTVNGETYQGERVLIATGSLPGRIPISGAEENCVLTSDDLLEKPFNKEHLLIIGGGVIGVEFAFFYTALGKQVTIIEGENRLLPQLDKEIGQNTAMILKRSGVKIYTNTFAKEIIPKGEGATCTFTFKDKEEAIEVDQILLAVGRKGNTQGLFLKDEVSPAMERGYIQVNSQSQSSLPWLYAVGDVTGGIQLAHKASAQAIACVEEALGKEVETNQLVVPGCVYTKPEIATVGLTQEEAAQEGIDTYLGKYVMSGNGRTLIEMGDRGFIKLVFDKQSDALLGAHLMCERATDMINELTLSIVQGLTREELLSAIRPHPTFSEGITEALQAAVGKSIHSAPARKK